MVLGWLRVVWPVGVGSGLVVVLLVLARCRLGMMGVIGMVRLMIRAVGLGRRGRAIHPALRNGVIPPLRLL
jgi:hypothetical protein